MKLHLEDVVSGDELRQLIEEKKTLQEVSDLAYARSGTRWSTAGVSKLCKKHKILMPRSGPRSGHLHKGWRGGRIENKDGYIEVYCPEHPNARKYTKYILEHRLVMERVLGRFLGRGEVVHHKNGVKTDNRPENLEVFESNKEHLAATLKGNCPKWSEEGKERIRAALRNRAPVVYSDAEKQRRRVQAQLRTAIQRELKLGGFPSKEETRHYLESLGTTWPLACEMVAKHGLQSLFSHPKHKHETVH